MREVEIDSDAKLSELIEMVKGTHSYLSKKYLILTSITLTFIEKDTGYERTFRIGSKSSDLE